MSLFSRVWDWAWESEALIWWLIASSVTMFVGTLLLVPLIAVRIPEDYFSGKKRRRLFSDWHPVIFIPLMVLKNAIGLVLLAAGVAMLVLPGQGVLTMLLGLTLLDFPGKFRLERWLIERPPVLNGINWLRQRAGVRPLYLGD